MARWEERVARMKAVSGREWSQGVRAPDKLVAVNLRVSPKTDTFLKLSYSTS